MKTDKTIEYYEKNAELFTAGTLNVEFNDVQDWFLSYIPKGGMILDFGCGSGRDTKYFLEKGYKVDSIDGSEALCEIASNNTGIRVRHMYFDELDEFEEYDGIWACASILHLPIEELQDVFFKMIHALRNSGYIYSSFKYGDFEGYRNDRYFTDFTEKKFQLFISNLPELTMIEKRITLDVRPGRDNEKWLNIIMRKSDII